MPSALLHPQHETISEVIEPFDGIDPGFVPHELKPGEPKMLADGVSVYDPSDVADVIGFKASVPAVVDAGGKRLMIVDLRSYPRGEDGYRAVPRQGGREEY